jgi:hypothetical protein
MPNGIVTAFDFAHYLTLFVVNGRFIVDSKAATSGCHHLMRRFSMTDEKCSKSIEEFDEM